MVSEVEKKKLVQAKGKSIEGNPSMLIERGLWHLFNTNEGSCGNIGAWEMDEAEEICRSFVIRRMKVMHIILEIHFFNVLVKTLGSLERSLHFQYGLLL